MVLFISGMCVMQLILGGLAILSDFLGIDFDENNWLCNMLILPYIIIYLPICFVQIFYNKFLKNP